MTTNQVKQTQLLPAVITVNNGVTKTVRRSMLLAEKFSDNKEYNKKGAQSVQLRQVVHTHVVYPATRYENNLQDNIFSAADFKSYGKEFTYKEERVAFIDVPEGLTLEQVQAKITQAEKENGACIYKITSSKPIVTEGQEYQMKQPGATKTMADYANSQVVQDGNGNLIIRGDKVVFRRTFFWSTKKDDVNLITEDPRDTYHTPEIIEKINQNNLIVKNSDEDDEQPETKDSFTSQDIFKI